MSTESVMGVTDKRHILGVILESRDKVRVCNLQIYVLVEIILVR